MQRLWSVARGPLVLVALVSALLALIAAPAQARDLPGGSSEEVAEALGRRLVEQVTPGGVLRHATALQRIAEANGGNRAAGLAGYQASSEYVTRLLSEAGLRVSHQEFTFVDYDQTGPTQLARLSPQPRDYVPEQEALTLVWSASGEVTGQVQPVDVTVPPTPTPSSTSGCEASDFAGFTPGSIALVQRGTCSFLVKATNAIAAGAAGMIAFNEGQPGRTVPFPGNMAPLGGVGAPVDLIGVSISFADGAELYELSQQGPVTVRLRTSTQTPARVTHNVIAETKGGRADRVIVAGAHLDGWKLGPAINSNGSGVAALLETAVQLADERVRNKVRFTFWSAEKHGLVGTDYYLANLTQRETANIALYLNFDILGSRNWGRFVYDGDGSATGEPFPRGSERIENLFTEYFINAGRPVQDIGTSSAHNSFAALDIPVGGIFAGSIGTKTEEQAALWGGTAGTLFDPCPDLACDTIDNIDPGVLAENADAVAFAVGRYAIFAADIPA